jgi:NitT/TauT family transport system substrate-binding protein
MMDRRGFVTYGLGLAGSLALSACASRKGPSRRGDPIVLLLNPIQMAYLPIFYAFDNGYFADEGLNVEFKLYTGSANAQLPLLARGDVDVGGVIAAPALFNQAAAGFGIRLLCALTEPRANYLDGVSVMVRQDIWEQGRMRTLADLRGRSIDAAAQGNPIDLLIRYALREAKLTPDDVTLSYKVRSPSDVPYLFRERQVELAGVSEPTATFIARRGLATKWIGYSDVVPWYQDIFLAASDEFVRSRPDEVKALVRACLRATNAFDASRGAWSPAALATAAKWTKLDKEDLKATGHLPYWSLTGKVDAGALARVQDFWAERRLVRDPADIRLLAGQQAV